MFSNIQNLPNIHFPQYTFNLKTLYLGYTWDILCFIFIFLFSATNVLVFMISTDWNDPTNTILFLRLHKESQYVFKADVFDASNFVSKEVFL